LVMQKDVFFCLLNDLRVKFWFLCDFWWKRKFFWSFHCSVIDLKRFLRIGFDFCWFWSKVCSFMSFTWSFLVLGGEKNVFCKCFKWFFMKNDVFFFLFVVWFPCKICVFICFLIKKGSLFGVLFFVVAGI